MIKKEDVMTAVTLIAGKICRLAVSGNDIWRKTPSCQIWINCVHNEHGFPGGGRDCLSS